MHRYGPVLSAGPLVAATLDGLAWPVVPEGLPVVPEIGASLWPVVSEI